MAEGAKQTSAKQNAKALGDMDADEFMKYGLDSDGSGDELEEESGFAGSTTKNVETTQGESPKKKSKSADHKAQLSRLKEKDPTFYKFLQENDQDLLEFNDSDTDPELEDGEDEEDSNEDEDDNERPDSEDQDQEEAVDSDEDKLSGKPGKMVTMAMIKEWQKGLEKHSLHALKQTLRAFRSAVHGIMENLEEKKTQKAKFTFRVEGNSVFNAIVQLCLKQVQPVLNHHVGGTQLKHGKRVLPSSHKNWSQVKTAVKYYISDVLQEDHLASALHTSHLQLLRTLAEPTMLCVVLRHTHQLSPYYACYPKIAKAFVKRLVRMWASGQEHVQVLAFLGVSKMASVGPTSLLEFSLKQLYLQFVKNCKFTSPQSRPGITFMQNSLVEIFRVDPHLTYQHAFVYIRQLAIHLRNALLQKSKDSYQSVYNWQYVHCLHLWSRVLSEVHGAEEVLKPLIYPLVQTVIGAIKLLPTARYYPLRFHCVRSLNLLVQATDTYVPVGPFLLEILDSSEFTKKVKMSTAKPMDFSCILKVSKAHLGTKPFQDAVMDHVFELLLEFFASQAHSIAFPEMVLPAVITLRKFAKTTTIAKHRKLSRQLLEKVEEASNAVTNRRSTVSFSPKDAEEVERWTNEYKQQPNPLGKFYETWKSMKPAVNQHSQEEPEHSDSDSEEEVPRKRKRTKKNREKEQKIQKTRATPTPTDSKGDAEQEDQEDVVEDFTLSSDED